MSRIVRRSALTAACAGAAATIVVAAQTGQQRPPTFRGGAVLVTVDAYPQRDGRIVEGLTAADFVVLEDGKPQAVENIEFVRLSASLSDSERRDPNTQRESLALAADPHNRVFVVFLDVPHVTVEGSHDIRRSLVDTLNRIVAPNDLFGVMTPNLEPRHLTFGRKVQSIEDQLTRNWPWGERYRINPDRADPMEEILRACFEVRPRPPQDLWYVSDNGQQRLLYKLLIDRRREDRTLTSLESLVGHLGGIREARTVALVITDGWRLFQNDRGLADLGSEFGPTRPGVGVNQGGNLTLGDKGNSILQPSTCVTELSRLALLDNDRRLRDLIAQANRANVSFYPVTPAGLAAFDTPISESSRPDLVEDGNRLRMRGNGLRSLAESTDGIAIVNTNDLAGGMRRIVEDVSAYYLLGYYSTNTTNDGKYRRIEVKVKQPGLQVRARRGYFAPGAQPARAGGSAPSESPVPAGLDDALAPLARLRTTASIFTRAIVDGSLARVAVELPAGRTLSAPWNAGGDVEVVISGVDGRALPGVRAPIVAGTRGVLLAVPLTGAKPPVRVTTRATAAAESLDDSFELRDTPAALVGHALLYRATPAASSPLRPVADLQFRRGERLHVEWPLHGEVETRAARLLGRNGRPLAIPLSVTAVERDGRSILTTDLVLGPLTSGDYVVELVVSRGGTEERRLVAFRVLQ